MAASKLTLSADKRVIQKAKRLAAKRKTSVSAMFANLVEGAARAEAGEPDERVGPLTQRATGLIRLPGRRSLSRLMAEALDDKYGVSK